MTALNPSPSVRAGSIVTDTGYAGSKYDGSPSTAPATIPGNEARTGSLPDAFSFALEGDGMTDHSQDLPKRIARLSPPIEVRAANGDTGLIEGYASVFGGPADSYGDIIEKGAFARTIKDHKAEGINPAMLWAHDPSRPIGSWREMREDDYGLFVSGIINTKTIEGRDAHSHVLAGDVTGFSVGFLVKPAGVRKVGGNRHFTDVDLVEVSVVTLPANRRARVTNVKSELSSKSDLIDLLRAGGLAKAAAHRIAAGGWPALGNENHEKAARLAAIIQRATENLKGNSK